MPTFNQKLLIILGVVVFGIIILFTISNAQKNIQKPQNQIQTQQIDLQWNTNLNSAMVSAQKNNRLVFVDFYTDWCGYCKKLDEETFSDPDVKMKFSQKYVLVKINGDQNPDLTSHYQIYGYPTFIILDSKGNEIKRHEGFVTPAEILNII